MCGRILCCGWVKCEAKVRVGGVPSGPTVPEDVVPVSTPDPSMRAGSLRWDPVARYRRVSSHCLPIEGTNQAVVLYSDQRLAYSRCDLLTAPGATVSVPYQCEVRVRKAPPRTDSGTPISAVRVTLQPDPASGVPLYLQLAAAIEDQIERNRILVGERLPPQRTLALQAGISRNTVVQAYKELEHRGWIRSRVGRGTFATRPVSGQAVVPAWQPQFSTTISRLTTPFLGEVHGQQPAPLSLAVGKVPADPGIIESFRQMLDLVLQREGARAFDPGPPEGLPALRAAIAAHLGRGGTEVDPGEIIITAGARQSLNIAASILLDPGDVVAIEGPTYRGAIQAFQTCGAKLFTVPIDRYGMNVEALESLLAYTKVKLIYTVPTFQNPTGATMSLERRHNLLQIAAHHAIPIVEDDPYWELRYEGHSVPRLKALDDQGRVIHLGTFSKLVFPGVRVGWIAAPATVTQQAVVAKAAQGLHVSSLPQWAMARLLEEGLLDPHIRRACQRLHSKRNAFLGALTRHTLGRLVLSRPQGGFFIWAQLPPPLHATDVLKDAMARGVDFVPGPSFWASGGDPHSMRLCFARLDELGLEKAARRLGESISAVAAGANLRSVEEESQTAICWRGKLRGAYS